MHDDHAWDPEDKDQRPIWRAREVVPVLRGQTWARTEPRFVKGRKSGNNYLVEGATFSCGCVVSDDVGWNSCDEGLHPILASAHPDAFFTRAFMELRRTFDAVLSASWSSERREPEHFYEFAVRAERHRGLSFEAWQLNHDLLEMSIWQKGNLYADLTIYPGSKHIALFNGGNASRPDLLLEFVDLENCRRVQLGTDVAKALTICINGTLSS